jgi:hypothetical protein
MLRQVLRLRYAPLRMTKKGFCTRRRRRDYRAQRETDSSGLTIQHFAHFLGQRLHAKGLGQEIESGL